MAETKLFENRADLFVAAGAIVIVMMLIIPLPTVLLDLLMAVNLVLNLLILLIVLYTRKATDFSVFPTLLLVSTVFGLGLNVSSTRLILSQGMKFDGKMIKAFSTFVIGNKGYGSAIVIWTVFLIGAVTALQFWGQKKWVNYDV